VVQLSPVRYIHEKEKVVSEDTVVEDFMVPEEAYASGAIKKKTQGFTALMLLIAVILTVVIMKRR